MVLLCLIVQFSRASGQTVSGKIVSSPGGDPLTGVTIIADDTLGIISDSSGHYRIHLTPGKHILEFRMISFVSEKRNLVLKENENQALNISLNENAHELGIVVISAGKFEQRLEDVTVSMEVLKPELIEKRNTTVMDEAADYIPGVVIIDGQANIRGGSGWSYGAGSRVQILVDDLPQLTADAADVKWNFMPVENLEQVEVIKGASSVLFGSSALDGVINIRTAYPRDTPLTKINSFVGVYDKAFITTVKKFPLSYQNSLTNYSDINFFHSRKINRLDLVVGGNYFNDQGYRQGENEKRGRININTRYNFKTPGLSAGVNVNTMIAKATIYFLWLNDTTGGYYPAANTLSDSKTYRTNVDPFILYSTRGGSSHKLRSRWFNSTNENNTNQNSKSDLFYSEYQYQKHFKESFTITAGIVSIISKVKSELYQDHKSYQLAGYTQGDYRWNKLTVSAGARAEQNKVDSVKDKLTPVFRAGINFHALKETYLRASAGQGYRFPSIAEKYISTNVGGTIIFPNEDLQSEKGQSYEIGIKQGFRLGNLRGYIDAAVFRNDYQNMIEFVFAQWDMMNPNPLLNNGFKSINVGDTRIKGFEFTLMGEGKLTNDINVVVQAGYTYLDPRQLTYDSIYVKKAGASNVKGSDSTDFLKYRYRHMVKGDLEISRKKFAAGGSIRYTSRMENIDKIFIGQLFSSYGIDNYRKYHLDGDVIIDFRTSYSFTKFFQLSFIVKNAFNHVYMQRPADMQPPRVFALQAGFRF